MFLDPKNQNEGTEEQIPERGYKKKVFQDPQTPEQGHKKKKRNDRTKTGTSQKNAKF